MSDQLEKPLFDLVGENDSIPPTPNNVEPKWLNYPSVANHVTGDTFYADVINHYAKRLNEKAVMTDAHETTHMINNEIRNANQSTGRNNGFYLGNDKGMVLLEPAIRKSAVATYVPKPLRGSRYALYVTGQTDWDDRALYIFDEWVAYVNGGRTGVDLVEKNKFKESWTDGVMGLLEFSIYGTAVSMAIAAGDSGYFAKNPQFFVFTKWLLRHAKSIYDKGSVMDAFKWDTQNKLLKTWRESPEAKEMRDFMSKYLEVSWLS
jgi:hypothetical protein